MYEKHFFCLNHYNKYTSQVKMKTVFFAKVAFVSLLQLGKILKRLK